MLISARIERELQYIDKNIGLQNTFIYLMGTGATDTNISDVPGINLGEFNANRCTALLNSHLISLFGQGQWVDGFNDGQIYLNHKTIEQRGLQLDDVAHKAAELVSLFSGVEEVYTQQQLLHQDYSQRITRIRNGYDYPLPEERIAKFPLEQRDHSKLLVYKDSQISESQFFHLPELLPTNTLLVFNNTTVIHARLFFQKPTGSLIEVFCLEPYQMPVAQAPDEKRRHQGVHREPDLDFRHKLPEGIHPAVFRSEFVEPQRSRPVSGDDVGNYLLNYFHNRIFVQFYP